MFSAFWPYIGNTDNYPFNANFITQAKTKTDLPNPDLVLESAHNGKSAVTIRLMIESFPQHVRWIEGDMNPHRLAEIFYQTDMNKFPGCKVDFTIKDEELISKTNLKEKAKQNLRLFLVEYGGFKDADAAEGESFLAGRALLLLSGKGSASTQNGSPKH